MITSASLILYILQCFRTRLCQPQQERGPRSNESFARKVATTQKCLLWKIRILFGETDTIFTSVIVSLTFIPCVL